MSATFAALAGILAVLNPCGIVLLPPLLSVTGAADSTGSSPSVRRAARVGLILSAGAALSFGLVAVPVTFGAQRIADAVPWLGLIVGVAILGLAILVLIGKRITGPRSGFHPRSGGPGARGLILAGAGYGITSLGCGLPMVLVAVGAALASNDRFAVVAAMAAYASGMALVLVGLTLIVAVVRDGAQRLVGWVRPRLRWVNGGLLMLAGGYLTYYWSTALFAWIDYRADSLIGAIEGLAARTHQLASTDAGMWLLLVAIAVPAAVLLRTLWHWARGEPTAPDTHVAPQSGTMQPSDCGCAAVEKPVGHECGADIG